MTYFDPTPKPKHQCVLPEPMGGNPRGWRCECGKAYVLEMLPARDTNPGENPYQWERAPLLDDLSSAAIAPPHIGSSTTEEADRG